MASSILLGRYLLQEEINNHDDTTNDLISATVVFSLASFIGNFGVALTGFGMAIFFLFVYTIFEAANVMECSRCGLKDAVFYQTLALGGAIPLLLYKARNVIRANSNKVLLLTFIPATVAGTPLGKFLQEHLPSDIVRVIMGVAIIVAMGNAARNLIRGTTWYKNRFGGDKKNVDESAKDVEQNSAMDPDTLESDESLPEKDLENDEPNEDFQDEEELKDKEEDLATIPKPQQQEEEQLPHGKKLIFWGVTLGFLSGFLGGLVGVRGPPIIIFFLFFSYPKPMVRANGILILLTNVFIRITYYVVEDLTGALERTWFESRLWYLYLCVIFFGMAGVPVGQYAAEKISGSQFKLVLCFMLLLSGLSNLIKGAIDIANR